jgi:hypothetical protein
MVWQDYVMGVVQVVFTISLIPTLLHSHHKPTVSTSAVTSVAVFIFVITIATLHMWLTAILMAINGIEWVILAWQRYKLDLADVKVLLK